MQETPGGRVRIGLILFEENSLDANNPDIDTIYEEDHPKIVAALDALNTALTTSQKNSPPPPSRGSSPGRGHGR